MSLNATRLVLVAFLLHLSRKFGLLIRRMEDEEVTGTAYQFVFLFILYARRPTVGNLVESKLSLSLFDVFYRLLASTSARKS